MRSFLTSDQGDVDRLTDKLVDADRFTSHGEAGILLRDIFFLAKGTDGLPCIAWPGMTA